MSNIIVAKKDLRDKLIVEKQFLPKLRAYHKDVVDAFRVSLFFDPREFDEEITSLLASIHMVAIDLFSDQVSQSRSDVTDGERARIDSVLAAWVLSEAPARGADINATTLKNSIDAASRAKTDALLQGLTGIEARLTEQQIATNIFKNKLRGRESTLLMSSVQSAAETAKATEVEVLAGLEPSLESPTMAPSPVLKEWVSVGDSNVRPWHIDADGITVTIDKPFIVMGEKLRRPGDTGFGASPENILGCRCGAAYDRSILDGVRDPNVP